MSDGLKGSQIKALSVVAPSGGKIASGVKTLGAQRWAPPLTSTGDLLIVENRQFLRQAGDEDPDGRAVAIVRVTTVRPFTRADMTAACASSCADGWLAWELADIRPVAWRGAVLAARDIYLVDWWQPPSGQAPPQT